MRSHDLARQLLEKPDMDVIVTDMIINEAYCTDDLAWPSDEGGMDNAVQITVEVSDRHSIVLPE